MSCLVNVRIVASRSSVSRFLNGREGLAKNFCESGFSTLYNAAAFLGPPWDARRPVIVESAEVIDVLIVNVQVCFSSLRAGAAFSCGGHVTFLGEPSGAVPQVSQILEERERALIWVGSMLGEWWWFGGAGS